MVAGFFDGTALTPNAGQTVFNWTPSSGAAGGDPKTTDYQVGAANPIVSQASVVDNTWHHVALVVQNQVGQGQASQGQELLYLDGQLVGQVLAHGGSPYSFTPTLTTGHTASGPSGFAIGGTTMPEPNCDALSPDQLSPGLRRHDRRGGGLDHAPGAVAGPGGDDRAGLIGPGPPRPA